MKIMIIDTQGAGITDAYRSLLPGISIRGIEPDETRGTPCHPHGAWCGWLAAIAVVGAGHVHTDKNPVELIFVRCFDKDAAPIAEFDKFVLDAIELERPDYISRSWGAWDQDSAVGEMYGAVEFQEFIQQFTKLQKEIGFVDFGAAGNSDANDADSDVDFPQRLLVETTNVIGACQRNGVPTEWSGDGPGVLCVMWADKVNSPDITGKWTLWSGTSAATPKACGACAALRLDHEGFRRLIKQLPDNCRPVGDWPRPHPKWGEGCAEDLWQNQVKRVPTGLLPLFHTEVGATARIEYFDYKRVQDEDRPEIRDAKPRGKKAGHVKNSAPAQAEAIVMNRAIKDVGDGWFHLAPFGEFDGELIDEKGDGKPCIQVMDRAAFDELIEQFSDEQKAAGANWRGLLLDKDHLSAMPTGTTEAMGRIVGLAVRGDGSKPEHGLYCKIDFSPPGREAVTQQVYSFLSLQADVAFVDGTTKNDTKPRIRPFRLEAAALTNKPNLPVRAMNRATGRSKPSSGSAWNREDQPPASSKPAAAGKTGDRMNHKEMLCKLLGLPADATDEQVQNAMTQHQQEVQNRKTETEKLTTRIQTLEAAALDREADEFCETHAGVIQDREAVKKQYVANKAATIALFGAVKPASGKVLDRKTAKTPAGTISDKDDVGKKQNDAVTQIMNRDKIGFSAAWSKATQEKPELFPDVRPAQ